MAPTKGRGPNGQGGDVTTIGRGVLTRLLTVCLALLFLLEPFALPLARAVDSVSVAPTEVTVTDGASATPASVTEVELPDERTAYSREFARSDGTRRAEVSLEPLNYRDSAGAYQPIDSTVAVSSRAGFAFENLANSFRSFFADRGTLRIEAEGVALTLAPVKPAKADGDATSAPTVEKDRLTYRALFPGVDARYTVGGGKVKEELLLADAKAPTLFEFRLAAEGLTPELRADGSVALLDGTGVSRFVLPRPFATDSAEKPAFIDISQELVKETGGYLLRVRLDPQWLADPARVFPVVVDPTVVAPSVNADTYVSSLYPTQSYGSSLSLHVATEPGASPYHGTEQSLIKFVLPTLPEYAQIQSATISLYATNSVTPQNRQVSASRVTSSWTGSVTWNTRPSFAGTPDSTTLVDGVGTYAFDITPSAQAWYGGAAANYGTLLSLTAQSSSNCRTFDASEATRGGTPPSLSIVYKAGDPRHTPYDLGEFAGHSAQVVLDKSRLELTTTDLAIASFGPAAALSRHYSSARTAAGGFAYGFRFNYEQKLTFVGSAQTNYTDVAGEVHTFFYESGAWVAPQGLFASLGHPGSTWTLTLKDRTVLTFDSYGTLLSETDRNGNSTTYTWSSPGLIITAANGQQIVVTLDRGTVTSAVYATADGTRQVNYSTAAPWQVTYFPGTSREHTVTYTYDGSNRLTEVKALAFTALAGDAKENFIYTAGALTEVRFPDYASSVPLYNASNADARALFSYGTLSATVTRYGAVRTSGTPTGATGTVIAQDFTWNTTGTLATKTNPRTAGGATETWSYAYQPGTNLLLSETSLLGKQKQWTYDTRGNLLTEDDELLHQTTYAYPTSDSDPNRDFPLTVTDPVGAVTAYTYDPSSNVTAVTRDLTGSPTYEHAETTYTYQNQTVGTATYYNALIQERSLVSGTTWTQTDYNTDLYFANGEPKKTVYRGVDLYDPASPPPSPPTSPVDLTTTRTYDAFGNLLTETDASGQMTGTNTYNAAGYLLTSTGAPFEAWAGDMGFPANQITTNHTWDAWRHETSTYRTASGATADKRVRAFDAAGRVSTDTAYLGTEVQNVTTYRYDGLGREITSAQSTMSGQPFLQAYDARGNLVEDWVAGLAGYDEAKATRHLLADGSSAYDAVGRVLRTTAPGDANPAILLYTDDGQVSRQTLPDGTYTDHTYDNADRQTGTSRSDGGTTSTVYDLGGRATSATDENNQTTSFTYDLLGRQLTAAGGGAPASTTLYNTLGWVLTRTDADGIATTTAYDSAGRGVRETTAAQATTSTYDPAGDLTERVDPSGAWISYQYDRFGRQGREWHRLPGSPPSTVKDTATGYDGLGRAISVTDNVTEVTHVLSYPLNSPAPTTDILGVGGIVDRVQTTLTLGSDGLESTRLSTIASYPQVPDVLHTVTARDSALRVVGVTVAAGQPTPIAANYLYDGAGRLSRQWGNSGGGSGYAADAESTTAYAYDALSGKKSADNLRLASVGTAGPIVASYTYTDDGRLDMATIDGVTEDDTFAPSGNLISLIKGGVQTTLTYDAANRLATTVTGGTTSYYSYDQANGWRTSQGLSADPNDPARIRYTYTGTGRLASYTNPGTGVSASHTYDAQGQRTLSVVTQGGQTTTTRFTYEGLTLLRLEATQTGGVNPTSWRITYLHDEQGTAYAGVYRSPIESTNATVFGIVTTDRGDVVALTDAAGASFGAYRYDAWGNPQGTGNLGTGIWSQTTTLIDVTLAAAITTRQPLRYAGYYYDSESGLYYLSARTHDPLTRQFVTKDPAKADGQESAYQYCGGEPAGTRDVGGTLYTPIVDTEARALRYRIRTVALKWVGRNILYMLGAKYTFGSTSDKKYIGKLDCSGFVQIVLNEAGVPGILKCIPGQEISSWGLFNLAGKNGTPTKTYFNKGWKWLYYTGDILYQPGSPGHIVLVISDGSDPEIAECAPFNNGKTIDGTQKWKLSYRWDRGFVPTGSGRYFYSYAHNIPR